MVKTFVASSLDEDKDVYFKDPVSHEFIILMLRCKDEDACRYIVPRVQAPKVETDSKVTLPA